MWFIMISRLSRLDFNHLLVSDYKSQEFQILQFMYMDDHVQEL